MSEHTDTIADSLNIAPEICDALDLQSTLRAACQYAIEVFKAHHSALLLLSNDRSHGKVFAESPTDWHSVGTIVPVTGVAKEERLFSAKAPMIIEDVKADLSLGPVRDILLRFNIRSIVVFPIVSNNSVYGSFSVDALDVRKFSSDDITLGKQIANQVATAIDTARHFHQLEQIRRLSASILEEQSSRESLLRSMVQSAKELFRSLSAGFYEYDKHSEVLTLIAECNGYHLFKQIRVGQGIAGRLVEARRSDWAVPDQDCDAKRVPLWQRCAVNMAAVQGIGIRE